MIVPRPLIDDIEGGKCVPFIGAGFSMNAKLPSGRQMPDWAGLTAKLAADANVSPELGGPAVASAFERRFGRVQLIEAIRKALHTDYVEPGDAHLAFASLPFDTVYTTNFDLLLEDAFTHIRKPFRSIAGEQQMPFHGGFSATSIIKMHGDLRHEEHIVVTTEDYARYLKNYPVIATHLSAQLITRSALFIGYSLTDPDFVNIRKVIRSRLGKFERMSYVIAFDACGDEIDQKLRDNLHVICIMTQASQPKGKALAGFFRELQEKIDTSEGMRFRAARPELFEEVRIETLEQTAKSSDALPLFASSSNLCFVMMPFSPGMNLIYRELIKPVAEQFGLSAIRADEIHSSGAVTEQIRVAIQQSRLCIADITGANPNVIYEVGIAHTLGKPTVLLADDNSDIPFDVRNFRLLGYDLMHMHEARLSLKRVIQQLLEEDRFDEARRLIDDQRYRAAAAALGALLEHSLKRLIEKYSDRFESRPAHHLRLKSSVRLLVDAGVLDRDDAELLECTIDIRNRAVHHLDQPRQEEVLFMLDIVKNFAWKYLGGELENIA